MSRRPVVFARVRSCWPLLGVGFAGACLFTAGCAAETDTVTSTDSTSTGAPEESTQSRRPHALFTHRTQRVDALDTSARLDVAAPLDVVRVPFDRVETDAPSARR